MTDDARGRHWIARNPGLGAVIRSCQCTQLRQYVTHAHALRSRQRDVEAALAVVIDGQVNTHPGSVPDEGAIRAAVRVACGCAAVRPQVNRTGSEVASDVRTVRHHTTNREEGDVRTEGDP